MKNLILDTIAIVLIVAWSLNAFGQEPEIEIRFGFSDAQKLEMEKKFDATIVMSCTTGPKSYWEYMLKDHHEVLILKSESKFHVILKREKPSLIRKSIYFRVSKIHINKGKHEVLVDSEAKLEVKHRHFSPFYPLKISLEVDKQEGTGLYQHKGTNGIFGVLGDSDTYFAKLNLIDCK